YGGKVKRLNLSQKTCIQYINNLYQKVLLDFERSDECIDFTMMCVFFFFFVSVTTFWSMDPVSDRKVNLVGTLGGQNVRKNPNKVTEKREFLTKSVFDKIDFFI
ncbi:Uncharacterized protein FWK35_00003502, partial [Aphis craccivora]